MAPGVNSAHSKSNRLQSLSLAAPAVRQPNQYPAMIAHRVYVVRGAGCISAVEGPMYELRATGNLNGWMAQNDEGGDFHYRIAGESCVLPVTIRFPVAGQQVDIGRSRK